LSTIVGGAAKGLDLVVPSDVAETPGRASKAATAVAIVGGFLRSGKV
jgi:hypothetical protein